MLDCLDIQFQDYPGSRLYCFIFFSPRQRSALIYLFVSFQVKEARSKVSEKLAKMHDEVLNANEESKDLEKVLKDLTKEVHALNIEKEAAEKREIGSDKKADRA